jgi:TolA-binding protein
MSDPTHRLHGRLALAACLASLAGAAGCGQAAGQKHVLALTDRLDLLDAQNAELEKQVKSMSMRITELENLVLKQKNELNKVKVAQATAPKTLGPEPEPEPDHWQDEVVVVAGEEQPDVEEDRPLLKIYGAPAVPAPVEGSYKPASLDAPDSIPAAIALKLPSLEGEVPDLEELIEAKGQKPPTVDAYGQGVLKYEAKEWSSAILYFDIYLKHEPKGANAMNAIFLKAESLYQIGKYLDAIGQFELIVERYPAGPRTAEAKLRIGRCYEKLGDRMKASSVYKDVIASHPGSIQAKKAGTLLQAMK